MVAHVMVAEKSNEIPTASELIEALGLKRGLFTLDAEHYKKSLLEHVIASGNHLLTQVKHNQPGPRRLLELGAPYGVGAVHQDRAAAGAHNHRCDPATGLLKQTIEVVYWWVSSADGPTLERWNEWIRGHWRIENGIHDVHGLACAEEASRIRKNPDIVARLRSFAYNLLRLDGCDNIRNA